MKKIMSLILALTMILSVGSLVASAASTEATNVTTVAPVNYAPSMQIQEMDGTTKVANVLKDEPDNNVFVASPSNSPNYYTNFIVPISNINSSKRETNNSWFIITLPEEKEVSAITLDVWKHRIKNYRIFATSNDELAAEIKSNAQKGKGLSEKGKTHKYRNSDADEWTVVDYNEDGIIDRLKAEGSLVASGTLNPSDAVDNVKETYYFDKAKKAKYIVFVVDALKNNSNGCHIDYIEVLGTTESNSTDIAQYPKTYLNYADKSVYPVVEACASKFLTDSEKERTSYGLPSVLVDPADTTKPNGVSDPAFMLSNANTYNTTSGTPVGAAVSTPNSWIAIDFGEMRTIDTVEIYQWKNRIKSVEVYALVRSGNVYGYDTVKANGGLNPSDNFYATYTQLIGSATFDHGTNTGTALNVGSLNNPDVINLGQKVTCEGILIKVTEVVSASSGVIMRRIMAKDSTPIVTYENAYPEGGIDYTVKFVNDGNVAKRYAIVEAQYNEAGEMIANNIKYVNIDPLYTKSFAGKIEKVDGAKTIKVFSWCLDELKPLETEYTFNVQ